MRKGLSIAITSVGAPATFPGMPVRVWDGTVFQERTISPAPERGWWSEPDAWVHHPTSASVREGILWAHNRWHLSTTWVKTCKLETSHGYVADQD